MELNLNELTYLSTLSEASNPLSPLKKNRQGDPEAGKRTLEERKLVVNGIPNEAVKGWLGTLADPAGSGRVAIREGNVLIEKIGYRKGDSYLLVENRGEELDLSAPEHLKETLLALSQITGMSRVIAYDIDLELTPWDAYVYLALVDLYRKAAMLGLWGEEALEVDRRTLADHLKNPVPGSLVAIFRDFRAYGVPGEDQLDGILLNLEDQGVLTSEGPRFIGDHGRFAMEFLVPRAVTTLEVYNTDGDQVAGNESLVISAGLNEHLQILFGAEGISLSLISGS